MVCDRRSKDRLRVGRLVLLVVTVPPVPDEVDDDVMAEAATVLPRYPQAKENVRVATKNLSDELFAEIEQVNRELDGSGRILVRASGTEPVVRVLAEAENPRKARELCARISALVTRELG